jgi:hypothetical protein
LLVDVVHIGVANEAVLVDDEQGALAVAFRTQDAVFLGGFSMWPKIAQQRVINAPQAVSPGPQAGYAVNAEAQNLGLDPIEPVESGLVGWDLACSNRRPGQGEKGQYDVAYPAIIAQTDGLPQMAVQANVGGGFSN